MWSANKRFDLQDVCCTGSFLDIIFLGIHNNTVHGCLLHIIYYFYIHFAASFVAIHKTTVDDISGNY